MGYKFGSLTKRIFKGGNPSLQAMAVPTMTPEQQALYNQMAGLARARIGGQKSPSEQKYLDFLKGYKGWAKETTSSVYDPQYVKDYYKSSVIPAMEEDVLPGVREEYAGPGYWGSARAEAVSKVYRDVGRQEAADIYGVEGKRQEALMGLLSQQPNVEQMMYYMEDPFLAPSWKAATEILGMKTFEPVTWMKERPGFMNMIFGG